MKIEIFSLHNLGLDYVRLKNYVICDFDYSLRFLTCRLLHVIVKYNNVCNLLVKPNCMYDYVGPIKHAKSKLERFES